MSNKESEKESIKKSSVESQSQFHYFGSLIVVLVLSFLLGLLSAPYIFKNNPSQKNTQLGDGDFSEDGQADLNDKSTGPSDANSKNTSIKTPENTLNFKIKRDLIKQELGKYIVHLKSVGLIPFEDPKTGEPSGFMVTNVERQSLFYRYGIRENDILKAVNDEPTLQMNQAFLLFGKLTMDLENLKTVKLKIIRKNKIFNLNYLVID